MNKGFSVLPLYINFVSRFPVTLFGIQWDSKSMQRKGKASVVTHYCSKMLQLHFREGPLFHVDERREMVVERIHLPRDDVIIRHLLGRFHSSLDEPLWLLAGPGHPQMTFAEDESQLPNPPPPSPPALQAWDFRDPVEAVRTRWAAKL